VIRSPADLRRVSPVAILWTGLLVLVLATAAGMAANWPRHTAVRLPGALRHPPTVHADVVAVREVRCATPGHRGCERATVRLRRSHVVVSLDATDPSVQGGIGVGDDVLVYRNPFPPGARGPDGRPVAPYALYDFARTGPLVWLAVVFGLVAVATARVRGLRALLGLCLSLAIVVGFVVPAIAHGRPPVAVAAFGGLAVMLLTIPLVHGGGAKSLAACLGTASALLLTLALADVFTRVAHLNGATSDAALYAQAASAVSLRGLLLAGMVIGALGVLGDTTVTQASTVIALRRANPELGFRELVGHARVVGHDHIAATVNTLVLAYAGAAVPTLLVFSLAGMSVTGAVNGEPVADAIAATLVGSIGLMAAVPLTTILAAWLARGTPPPALGDPQPAALHDPQDAR
jgi:uncharacterized membrane protein